MKKKPLVLSIILISLMSYLVGCKARETASNNSANSTAPTKAAANSNQPGGASADSNANKGGVAVSPPTPVSSGPPKLVGTYEAREVEDKGIVTIISQIKTIIVFTTDGNYSRASQNKGKTYHTDSGQFRIEEPDKLVLTIQISDKNIQSPAVTKTHKFSLSPDGDELKLDNDKGATATYQRTAKPKAS